VHLSPAILAGNSKKFKNAIINTLPSSEVNQKMGIFFSLFGLKCSSQNNPY